MANKTFIKITNQDIFNEVREVRREMAAFKLSNASEHENILIHQYQTNGKVKVNTWRSTTALGLCVTLITILIGAIFYLK